MRKINASKITSSSLLIKCGALQVSVPSPLYFIIYVNSFFFFQKLKTGKTIMYTDDTSILNFGINPEELKLATFTTTRQITQYFE